MSHDCRRHAVAALAAALLSSCYLAHERDPRDAAALADALRVDAGIDGGTDAYRVPDVGLDVGRDIGTDSPVVPRDAWQYCPPQLDCRYAQGITVVTLREVATTHDESDPACVTLDIPPPGTLDCSAGTIVRVIRCERAGAHIYVMPTVTAVGNGHADRAGYGEVGYDSCSCPGVGSWVDNPAAGRELGVFFGPELHGQRDYSFIGLDVAYHVVICAVN